MKQLLKSYTIFTRTEKARLLGLFLLIAVLLTIRISLPYWADPNPKPGEIFAQEKTTTNHNKSQQNKPQYTDNQYPEDFTSTGENNNNLQHQSPVALRETTTNTVPPSGGGGGAGFPFDPNTIDSTGLRQLGLREQTTRIFLNWRRKGKRFYKKEELKKLYTLTAEEYNRLEPYIIIGSNTPSKYTTQQKVNINTADSLTLIRLKGIGPAIAHRILQKRRAKGRFKTIEEVLSVYHFSAPVAAMLKHTLVLE